MTYRKSAAHVLIALVALLSLAVVTVPSSVQAGILSALSSLFMADKTSGLVESEVNSQNMPLLRASLSPNPLAGKGGGDITIIDGSAVASETGPLGAAGNIEEVNLSHEISIYVVRPGDNVASIAKMYGVSPNTIIWANDLNSKAVLKEGQTLVILPISGVLHTIKKGDTLSTLAKKYKADISDILLYNDLASNADLVIGSTITIPDGEIAVVVAPPSTSRTTSALRGSGGASYPDYYNKPVDGRKTQGLHGYNGIDFGAPTGTPVYAAAAGDVIIARSSGWNGGYGSYVVVSHNNGTQTLYAHLSKVNVVQGQRVIRGQHIGNVGNTGKSTGPHLHFEVRGAKNPF